MTTLNVLDHGFVRLVDYMGSDMSIVNAARISFGVKKEVFDEKDEKLVKYLIEHNHSSPLRHAYLTLHFKAPIFLFRQFMKHSVGCLTGDAQIATTSGSYSLNQLADMWLAERYDEVRALTVLSVDDKSTNLVENSISEFFFKGLGKIVTAVFDNGNVLRATADHKVLTPAGWEKIEDCEGRVVYTINSSTGDIEETTLIRVQAESGYGEQVYDLSMKNQEYPNFLANGIVVHNCTWNEVSARYRELPSEFYLPEKFRAQARVNKQGSEGEIEFQDSAKEIYSRSCSKAYAEYEALLDLGVAREQARGVLPVGIYSEAYCTASLQAVAHFIKLRADAHAQWEAQQYAHAVRTLVEPLYPVTMRYLLAGEPNA